MRHLPSSDGRFTIDLREITSVTRRGPWADRWREARDYADGDLQATITFQSGLTVTVEGNHAAALLAGLEDLERARES